MNVAMTAGGSLVEAQGTGEGAGFDREQLEEMLRLAERGIRKLLQYQREAIGPKRSRKRR